MSELMDFDRSRIEAALANIGISGRAAPGGGPEDNLSDSRGPLHAAAMVAPSFHRDNAGYERYL